jgi:UDP-glucose 4-epimerase
MHVLITGGAGFVGSHLVDHHLAHGDEVTIIDDFSTGSHRNIAHHAEERAFHIIEGRVEDEAVIKPAIRRADRIYHLAATVGVFQVLRHPLHALRSNLAGSDIVFELAAEAGVRTVFTSTSEVYGKNDAPALHETDDSIFGATSLSRWLYGVSKAADEFLALAYEREKQLPVTIVRLFNTTGPRQSGAYGMVLPRFVQQALDGKPLTVFGDGSQTRCFTNVFDVVDALTGLAEQPEAIGRVVNVGHPHETSISDLARLVKDITASESEIEYLDYSTAYGAGFEDMKRRFPDVNLLRYLIGRVPSTPLETTIEQIVDFLRTA